MSGLTFVTSASLAFLIGTLVEYGLHRAMHTYRLPLFTRLHMGHHAHGEGKGVLKEFAHYMAFAWVLMPWGFLWSTVAGWGWLAGGVAMAFFAALAHQMQHDNPRACWWMISRHGHWSHHHFPEDRANYGISVDWWDHVFGTHRERSVSESHLPAGVHGRPLGVKWK